MVMEFIHVLDKEISYHNTIAAPQRELCFGHNDFK
jgi:hypothetical protein